MKIFIGSSSESLALAEELASWLESANHEAVMWNAPNTFLPGENTLLKLISISSSVDAAVFVFSEDDKTWYRGDAMMKPRDNVIFEYGLFTGAIGQTRSIICRSGQPSFASDLAGLTTINISNNRKLDAKVRINAWLNHVASGASEEFSQYKIQIAVLKKKIDELKGERDFERSAKDDLRRFFSTESESNQPPRSHYWLLLFNYKFFWKCADVLLESYKTPSELRALLSNAKLIDIMNTVYLENSSDASHGRWFLAKVLRTFRKYHTDQFERFFRVLPLDIVRRIDEISAEMLIEEPE